MAFSADERKVTILTRRGEGDAKRAFASTWILPTAQRIGETDLDTAPAVTAFSADGTRVALGSVGHVRVIDTASGRVIADTPLQGTPAAVALSANGKFLTVLTDTGTVSALQLDPLLAVAYAERAASAVDNLLAISADGRALVAINADGNTRIGAAQSVRRWRTDSMAQPDSRPIGQMTSGFAAAVCALSASGEAMAVNTSNAALHVRDTASGHDLAVVDEAWRGSVCAFSVDGRTLASIGSDGSLRVWDIAAREEVARMDMPGDTRAIAFSPSGHYVGALAADGVLQVWPLRYADLLAQACARVASNMAAGDWERFVPGKPYRPTCDKLPAAPEARR